MKNKIISCIGVGLCAGVALGVIVFDSLAVGAGVGVAIGAGVGAGLGSGKNKEK